MPDPIDSALAEAPEHVADLLRSGLPPHFTFHTYGRAERVVKLCGQLAEASGLKHSEQNILTLAAWFIDTGFVESTDDHEEQSVRIAAEFLEQHGVADDVIARVARCIRVTTHREQPGSAAERILADADSAFTGRKKFGRHLRLLRLEEEGIRRRHYTETEWLRRAADIVAGRSFHTQAGRARFEKRRSDHLVRLREELRRTLEQEEMRKEHDEAKRALLEAKREKQERPERGIETMFRTAPQNHLTLSSIADQKANILITVNALVISIVLTQMFRNLDDIQALLFPTLLLLGVCVLTIIFATLATKPKLTTGTFSREDIRDKKANLLFFGNFYRMPYQDFAEGMHAMMNDREYLYGTMIRDFFNLGQVLGRKYFHLRIAYNVFMYGIAFSVLAFAVALLR